MSIKIISIGEQMPNWLRTGVDEYLSRIPDRIRPSLIELPRPKGAHKQKDLTTQVRREAQALESKLSPEDRIIAFDRTGKSITTEKWAASLEQWQLEGLKIAFLIGGSDGLAPELLMKAHEKWSLSNLTFPHMLVRLVVAEQHYRAWSILQGLPYHK